MEEDICGFRLNKTRKLPGLIAPLAIAIAGMFLASGLSVAVWGLELDSVDIGNVGSEVAEDMEGWGPVVTGTGGGAWGGLDGDCRVVWAATNDDPDDESWATVTLWMPEAFKGAAQYISMNVLDGQAEDSFSVSVYNPETLEWIVLYEYEAGSLKDPDGEEEQWIEHTIWLNDLETWECLVPHGAPLYTADGFQIMVEATGEPWDDFDEFGQLAVDWIVLYGSGRVH